MRPAPVARHSTCTHTSYVHLRIIYQVEVSIIRGEDSVEESTVYLKLFTTQYYVILCTEYQNVNDWELNWEIHDSALTAGNHDPWAHTRVLCMYVLDTSPSAGRSLRSNSTEYIVHRGRRDPSASNVTALGLNSPRPCTCSILHVHIGSEPLGIYTCTMYLYVLCTLCCMYGVWHMDVLCTSRVCVLCT